MRLKLLPIALGAALSVSAMAAPVSLTGGPLFFQFTNFEQTALGVDRAGNPLNNTNKELAPGGSAGTCLGCTGAAEGNWGIAQISVMRTGIPAPAGAAAGDIGNDVISAGTPPFFVDQLFPTAGGQVTAMWYGVVNNSIGTVGTLNTLKSSGGYMDLYWDDPSQANTIVNIGTLTAAGRTSDSTFAGVTDGTFLGRLAFASGIDLLNPVTAIAGTIDTALLNLAGSADSFANVVDVNGDGKIDSLDGLWAGQLNTDWFGTTYGTRDFKFSNKIQNHPGWNGAAGTGVLGQDSNDPGRGYVPEPASLALVSLGLLGLGASRRRRSN